MRRWIAGAGVIGVGVAISFLSGPGAGLFVVGAGAFGWWFGRNEQAGNQPDAEFERFTGTLERMGEGMFLADLEGTVLFANPALCALTGFGPDHFAGATVAELLTQRDGRRQSLRRHNADPIDVMVRADAVDVAGRRCVLRVVRDMSAQVRAERAARESKALLLDAERIANVGHWSIDLTTGLATWSEELHRMAGQQPKPISEADFRALVLPEDWSIVESQFTGTARTGGRGEFEFRIRRQTDGAVRWIYWKADRLDASPGQAPQIRGIAQDVTRRRRREDELRQAARVFESTRDAVLILDAEGRIEAVNRAFTTITGYVSREVVGQSAYGMLSDAEGPQARAIRTQVTRLAGWQGEVENRKRDGSAFPAMLTVSVANDHQQQPGSHIWVFTDITELKAQKAELEFLAHHDVLTSLPNRNQFKLKLGEALARARDTGGTGALLQVDLDRFKLINDSLGHPMGDEVLRKMSTRLEALGHTLCRMGGDEFAVLLETADDDLARQVARQLIDTVEVPVVHDSLDLALSASVGIALFPRDGASVDDLFQNVDAAMYEAKAKSPGSYRYYDVALTERARDRAFLVGKLSKALNQGQLFPVFQPQWDLRTGELVGLEALVRWRDTDGSMISPGRFIPLAEESGLIVPLGTWMLRAVCTQARVWLDEGYDIRRIAVNISAPQLAREGFVETVGAILRETGMPPERLELELTETAVMTEAKRAAETFEALRALGVSLAIDDFGTGHSSLVNLIRLPFDKIKIDKQFVFRLPEDPTAQAIVQACIALGKAVGKTVTAEGVETEEQERFLAEAGCDLMQGFLRARPDPSPAVERYFTPLPTRPTVH